MKFKELLEKYTNKEIIKEINKYYDDVVDKAYEKALAELRGLVASDEIQTVKILVSMESESKEDGIELYLDCDGIGPDENGKIIKWGLEYDEWENWLAMEIDKDSFKDLGEITVLAAIMWEITYNGYSKAEVDRSREELDQRLAEVERDIAEDKFK